MNIFENENEITVTIDNEYILDYQLKMIQNNNIGSLVPIDYNFNQDEHVLHYDLNDYMSIDDFVLRYEPLYENSIETYMNEMKRELDEYLLDLNNLYISKRNLYINRKVYLETGDIHFASIYIPASDMKMKNNNMIIQNIIDSKEFYKNHNIVEMIENNQVDKSILLEQMIEEDLKHDDKLSKKKNVSTVMLFFIFVFSIIIFRKSMLLTIISILTYITGLLYGKISKNIDDEKIYLNDDSDETVILDNFPYLKKNLLSDKIYISTNVFNIGKSNKSSLVLNNSKVSKQHAKIIKKSLGYYLVDMNSTNYTYVNDEKIEPNTEKILFNGDKLKFADEQYVFYCSK
ncbi:MAG: FHA domain-containing protein [Clostridia bacterium]|nr:FHA domain-containing protein [Clostridia bacterium]